MQNGQEKTTPELIRLSSKLLYPAVETWGGWSLKTAVAEALFTSRCTHISASAWWWSTIYTFGEVFFLLVRWSREKLTSAMSADRTGPAYPGAGAERLATSAVLLPNYITSQECISSLGRPRTLIFTEPPAYGWTAMETRTQRAVLPLGWSWLREHGFFSFAWGTFVVAYHNSQWNALWRGFPDLSGSFLQRWHQCV